MRTLNVLPLAAALAAAIGPSGGAVVKLPEYRVAVTEATAPEQIDWSIAQAVGFGPAAYATTFRALRGPAGLWVRFDAVDPAPWHTYTRRDDPLWEEEVVEIFVDPDGDGLNYAEVEINPANVVTDLLMFRGDPGKRSDIGWDFEGIRTWVEPTGDPAGWTATALLPWRGFASLPATSAALPPAAGDAWRFNVFRIKRPGGPEAPERDAVYAAWSPPPGPSFHVTDVFGRMVFE